MLLNLLSKEAMYFARGWEPEQGKCSRINIYSMLACYVLFQLFWLVSGLTYGDHQEADVTEPVRCFVGQLLHKKPQDGAEVTLVTRHCHLHRWWCLCIAVAAVRVKVQTEQLEETASQVVGILRHVIKKDLYAVKNWFHLIWETHYDTVSFVRPSGYLQACAGLSSSLTGSYANWF